MITVPDPFAAATIAREGEAGRAWIQRLPALTEKYLALWRCDLDGDVTSGAVGLIMPVRSPHGPAVLKISFTHPGNVDEPRALRLWQGNGAVQLYDEAPEDFALLLERVSTRQLDLPDDEAIAIGGELLRRLAVPATDDMPTLAAQAQGWEEQLHDQDHRSGRVLPRHIVGAALETIRDLAQDRTPTMTHGDLHAGNILDSDRGWVTIDPKGVAGNPAHDAMTMMLYGYQRALQAPDLRAEFDRRLTIFCDASGADPDWARRLTQARFVSGALWDNLLIHDGAAAATDPRAVIAGLLV
ncbi:streptomycin 6-kinase [Microlunatus endophyticus]|uniref:Streptomycin 6-kinase n=1 Tax=Microlunatus endophyticus TaxID=1716077 RepID=A0A917S600_9ACTN|nr:aminoglycoside phosphotransferase family protein [Microlunatus endophyticus]GGL55847.1 streptomycin 6-kinase [Microlunatus endophyticus]